jgi:carboxypeptidase Q
MFTRMKATLIGVGLAALPSVVTAQVAQEAVDLAVVQQIREEGLERSQMDPLAQYLTDVVGPRLTASPGIYRAREWIAERFTEWGLENINIEPWGEFGQGWSREQLSARILTPYVQPLQAQPAAWTGSTDGTVTGQVVVVQVDSLSDFERYRGKLANTFVLLDEPRDIEPEWEQWDRRYPAEVLLTPPERSGGGRPQITEEQRARMMERWQRMREIQDARSAMFAEEAVLGLLSRSSRNYGILRSTSNSAGIDPDNPEPLPQLIVSAEQYGQMYRNVERGIPVQLEVNVQNRFHPGDVNAYNILADIPGSDKADEYVMIGGHLDSWYMGTGAVDNAAGCLVMMEAMRILKALNLQPRRTIRIALWSGEEQGLLGSRAWVENHQDLHDKISAYLNFDNGTGKIRGIYTQMNEAVIPVFEEILWPFRDLGVVAVWNRNTGGTDHLAFDAAGIPGFQFVQDPIEYSQREHHTNLDTYDHMLIDDLMQSAVVVAATAYHIAMRDEILPRKEQPMP